MDRLSRSLIIAPACVLLAAGCQGVWPGRTSETTGDFGAFGSLPAPKLANPFEWGAEDEPRNGTPDRIAATWVDTVRRKPGETPERGFGGRLYFYDYGEDPIAVEGDLVVYAFDETGRAPTDHKPTRKYVFPAEQFARHMSESEIGASYSVWLPWGAQGGVPTDVSLIARFQPKSGGQLVVSNQATQRLPGLGTEAPGENATLIAATPPSDGVRLANFSPSGAKSDPPAAAPTAQPARSLSTTTIRLR